MKSDAAISPCGNYRWWLSRIWDDTKPLACFIMLNPSTADSIQPDPTITRCIGFAKSWGLGGMYVVNLSAYRATKPKNLRLAGYPGQFHTFPHINHAKRFIRKAHDSGGPVVCAWGVHGSGMMQAIVELHRWLAAANIHPRAFGQTKDGMPKHPLFLPRDAKLYTQEDDE